MWRTLLAIGLFACGRSGFDAIATPPGPAIVFHFDEGEGSTTTAEDGTAATMVDVDWTEGVRGSAVRISQTGYIDVPPLSRLVLPRAVTVAVWYRLDAMPGACMALLIHGGPLSSGTAGNVTYSLNLAPPRFQLFSEVDVQLANSTYAGAPADAFELGIWRHVVAVRDDANNVVFYLDGNTTFPSTTPQPVTGGDAGHLRIANDIEPSMCVPPPGPLDELYIYPRALTSDEVRMLHAAR